MAEEIIEESARETWPMEKKTGKQYGNRRSSPAKMDGFHHYKRRVGEAG